MIARTFLQSDPWCCFVFCGFEDAVSALSLWTNWQRLGLESGWGYPVCLGLESGWGYRVSEPCYRAHSFSPHGFALFFAVSKMLFRHHVSGRISRPLGLNPAGVLPFRNHAPQSLLRTWLIAVSNLSIYCFALPWFCFAFSGFEDAVSAPRLWRNWPSLGLESCWGSAVSQPCPTEPLADDVATPWP